jgi:hypothetical protein
MLFGGYRKYGKRCEEYGQSYGEYELRKGEERRLDEIAVTIAND